MSDKMIMRVAASNIFDIGRGLNMNKGVYIQAPPDFFDKYGKSTPVPTIPFDEEEHFLMKIENWPEIKAKVEDKVVEKRELPRLRAKNVSPKRATIINGASAADRAARVHEPIGMTSVEAAVPGAEPTPPRMSASELLTSGKNKGVDPTDEDEGAPADPPAATTTPAETTTEPPKPKAKPKAPAKAKAKAKPRKAKVS